MSDLSTLWNKFEAWAAQEAQDAGAFLSKEEQEVLNLVKPILSVAEADVLQDLVQFIRGVLTSGASNSTLADWETSVLNGLQKVGGALLTQAKGLGSNVLQALIALVLSQLPAA